MKTKTFALSRQKRSRSGPPLTKEFFADLRQRETRLLANQYNPFVVYMEQRFNGIESDSPTRCPYDGTFSFGTPDDNGECYVRYTEGPRDHEWMIEHDNRYLARLASGDVRSDIEEIDAGEQQNHPAFCAARERLYNECKTEADRRQRRIIYKNNDDMYKQRAAQHRAAQIRLAEAAEERMHQAELTQQPLIRAAEERLTRAIQNQLPLTEINRLREEVEKWQAAASQERYYQQVQEDYYQEVTEHYQYMLQAQNYEDKSGITSWYRQKVAEIRHIQELNIQAAKDKVAAIQAEEARQEQEMAARITREHAAKEKLISEVANRQRAVHGQTIQPNPMPYTPRTASARFFGHGCFEHPDVPNSTTRFDFFNLPSSLATAVLRQESKHGLHVDASLMGTRC